MEALTTPESCFVTLTYSPVLYPAGGSLVPSHLTHFLKLLRRSVSPRRFRFYSCGEYGEKNGAPHYHLSLFGLGPEFAPLIQRSWSLGSTATYPLSAKTLQYVAGYVTKGLTRAADLRLGGRFPEFARMSNRPGIGALSLQPMVQAIHTRDGLEYLEKLQDVPDHILVDGRKVRLGRYLRQKLREEIGAPEWWQARAKQNGYSGAEAEVFAVCQAQGVIPGPASAKAALLKENQGKAALKVGFSQLSPKKGSL